MTVSLAVVVVAWQNDPALDDCLQSLANQHDSSFEVVIADNGAGLHTRLEKWFSHFNMQHLDLQSNLGVSVARNRAAKSTSADVLLFLDDDGIADPMWTAVYRSLFDNPSIAAARGRVVGQSSSLFNQLARGYDLGDKQIPSIINTEGNCGIRSSDFAQCGGFNEEMFGHEGAELTGRIVALRSDQNCVVYEPGAVISHDYADNWRGYLMKRYRHGRMLRHMDPELVRASAARSRTRHAWTTGRVALAPVRISGLAAEAVGAVDGYLRPAAN